MKKRSHFGIPPTARQRARGLDESSDLDLQRHEAMERQRAEQQGLGRPVISTVFKGHRFVAVGGRLYHSPRWSTFHDFLIDYGRDVLGKDWWLAEVEKAPEFRHPVLRWFDSLSAPSDGASRLSRPMTGGVAAFLRLAYDLYCLKHNASVRDRLVQRLKDLSGFPGARHEVFVAAAFVRAGFTIEFEDEDDRTTSHVEFTATHQKSGKKYSVEAKHCASKKKDIGRHISGALGKAANHSRVVFIDLNEPDDGATGEQVPGFVKHALKGSRRFERCQHGRSLPPAYVFMTNQPAPHHLDGTAYRNSVLIEGFHIPEFKGDAKFESLRAAIDARDAHIEMERLGRSVQDHSDVPATFDGEAPEFAYRQKAPRLRIGSRYLIPSGGLLVPGLLESAIVLEAERVAFGSYALDDGQRVMVKAPLTDAEMAAYQRHPETFFGVIREVGKQAKDPIDLYDFFLETYSRSSTDKLLEFLAGAPDIDRLRSLDQPALAREYAERCSYATLARGVEPAARP